MRILQITKYYYPSFTFGGPVPCTYNISNYMVKQGHDVTVYTTDAANISTNERVKEKFQVINGAKVYYFTNVAKLFQLFISPEIIPALKKNLDDFDVVHLHEYRTFQNLAFYYSRKKTLPYVLSIHGEFEYTQEPFSVYLLRRLFNRTFGRKLLKNASKLFALTSLEAQQLSQSGIDENKIVTIPNAVGPEDFSNLPPKGYFRKLFGLKEDEQIILYVGRISKIKGLDILVQAFSRLKGQNNVKLVFAGADDGFLRPLQQLVASLNLGDKVLFVGSLTHEQKLGAFNDASVIVYASRQEGFPIVPLEAGIMGKPIIVSDHPSMDYVKKGNFGLVVERENVEQLKDALNELLENRKFAMKLGQNGRKYVTENHTWATIGKRIEDLYYSICR